MRIENKSHTQPVEQSTQTQRARKPRPQENDRTEFHAADSLRQALDAEPDVRADVVQRGRQLVADADYPPPEIIRRIANLLALGPEQTQKTSAAS